MAQFSNYCHGSLTSLRAPHRTDTSLSSHSNSLITATPTLERNGCFSKMSSEVIEVMPWLARPSDLFKMAKPELKFRCLVSVTIAHQLLEAEGVTLDGTS